MDKLTSYRQLTQNILKKYANTQSAYGNYKNNTVFDHENDHYLVMSLGWDSGRRVHGCLIHIDIINQKIWIQRDGIEHGIAQDFLDEGVPKSDIVLGFKSEYLRPYTEFAVN